MSRVPIVVAKLGGSLLVWDELPQRLQSWLDEQPPAAYVLIAGTGPLGDFVRQADERFHLGQEHSHWLCIDALSITARLLSQVLKEVPLVDSLAAVREADLRCVLDPRPFLQSEEATTPGTRLPHDWDATTDSIAARVAECLKAQRLVLLKSCDPPATSIEAASLAGFVDRHFPAAAATLPRVECVNLRGSGESIMLQGLRDD